MTDDTRAMQAMANAQLAQQAEEIARLRAALKDLREWGEPELDHPALDYVSVQIDRWAIKQADEALRPGGAPREGKR